MLTPSRARAFAAEMVALVAVAMSVACSKPSVEPLQLPGDRLTVDNQTPDDWRDVEIWLNSSVEVQKEFQESGLAGALGGRR